jgi:hypothetical protein
MILACLSGMEWEESTRYGRGVKNREEQGDIEPIGMVKKIEV